MLSCHCNPFFLPSGCQVDPRIDLCAQKIHQQIDHAYNDRHKDDRAQHHRYVTGLDGVEQQGTNAGDGEDVFRDHSAADGAGS